MSSSPGVISNKEHATEGSYVGSDDTPRGTVSDMGNGREGEGIFSESEDESINEIRQHHSAQGQSKADAFISSMLSPILQDAQQMISHQDSLKWTDKGQIQTQGRQHKQKTCVRGKEEARVTAPHRSHAGAVNMLSSGTAHGAVDDVAGKHGSKGGSTDGGVGGSNSVLLSSKTCVKAAGQMSKQARQMRQQKVRLLFD